VSGRARRAHLRQVVSEPDSCLYISDEGGIRGKEHSYTHQVVSERDFICRFQVAKRNKTGSSKTL
jgi:hypothetical protein